MLYEPKAEAGKKHRRRYRLTVAGIVVIVSLVAVGVALATVPAVRDHLCYEHRMNMFCSIAEIGESEIRIFAWHPDEQSLNPPAAQRAYGASFPRGRQQRLYWEARLKSRVAPDQPIRFVAKWTTYDANGKSIGGGVIESTWEADNPAALITGPVDTVPIGPGGQFPSGHYEVALKVYGNRLAESEVRGGFDIY
ncbi:MAG: hypothetical protein C3F08_09375 [Candidatus Methylomirabilota bacterium]|nr:MAG: hypothetical protein C3F08_09375 [candidate division NC10 bacterium]